jgi:hypothetical protein
MMNRIKRFSLACFTLGILLIQPNLVFAKFGGTLQNNEAWTLELTPANEILGPSAMTVTFVDAKGAQGVDLFTIPSNATSFVAYSQANIPRRTRRIIIDLDLPAGGFVQLRILQGTTVITVDCGDPNGSGSRVVFDVLE